MEIYGRVRRAVFSQGKLNPFERHIPNCESMRNHRCPWLNDRPPMLVTNAVAALTNGCGCYDSDKDAATLVGTLRRIVRWRMNGHARVIQSAASRSGRDYSAEEGYLEQKTDEAEPEAVVVIVRVSAVMPRRGMPQTEGSSAWARVMGGACHWDQRPRKQIPPAKDVPMICPLRPARDQ